MKRLMGFLVFIGTTVSCGSIWAVEPNEPVIPSVVFRHEDAMVTWSHQIFERIPGVALPTVLAEFYVRGSFLAEFRRMKRRLDIASLRDRVTLMRETPFWDTLSDDQLTFCRLNEFLWVTPVHKGTALEGYSRVQILAVTPEDAHQLARALVSAYAHKTFRWRAENLARLEEEITGHEAAVSEAKAALSVALTQMAAAESAYEKIKNSDRYRFRTDGDASAAAKAATLRMEAELDGTEIRIAEIRARLDVVDRYKQLKKNELRSNQAEALVKLDSMEVELTIELTGLTARRGAITKIMDDAKDFRRSYLRHFELLAKTDELNRSLSDKQEKIRRAKEELIRRAGESPFEVLSKHATIRPLKLQYSD